MCGVISAYLKQPNSSNIDTLKRLFVEGQIRGRHQTGLAYKVDGRIKRFVVEGDGRKLVQEFNWEHLLDFQALEIIGHNRYSTSDLQFPQPLLISEDLAIAHNGVVTQDPPEMWHRYGYNLTTLNDSELIYQARFSGREPLVEFPEASMAVCEISVTGGIRWYRNGKRPLHFAKVKNGWFVCSTLDIANRAGLLSTQKCKPGVVYTPEGSETIQETEDLIA